MLHIVAFVKGFSDLNYGVAGNGSLLWSTAFSIYLCGRFVFRGSERRPTQSVHDQVNYGKYVMGSTLTESRTRIQGDEHPLISAFIRFVCFKPHRH